MENNTEETEITLADRFSKEIMQNFEAKHLKKLVDDVSDQFSNRLWHDVETWLMADIEVNIASRIKETVRNTVNALLSGNESAMEWYPLSKEYNGNEIRKALVEHCGDSVLKMRIADLERELKYANDFIARGR